MSKARGTMSKLEKADLAAVDAARPLSGSRPMKIVSVLSEVGDQPQMRLLCGAVIAAGLVRGDKRLAGTGLRMLAAHSLATFAKNAIKHRIDRTRPRSKHKPGKDHRLAPGDSRAKEETSFPSGHSAGAAAVARAFARDYPEHARPAYAAAGAVAAAQIPRCAHYPSDVGAGLAIGVAAEALVDAAVRLVTTLPLDGGGPGGGGIRDPHHSASESTPPQPSPSRGGSD
ncbi:MAG TPA: phosphatase PAP2 family protein [Allosphingosinicella sp.]